MQSGPHMYLKLQLHALVSRRCPCCISLYAAKEALVLVVNCIDKCNTNARGGLCGLFM